MKCGEHLRDIVLFIAKNCHHLRLEFPCAAREVFREGLRRCERHRPRVQEPFQQTSECLRFGRKGGCAQSAIGIQPKFNEIGEDEVVKVVNEPLILGFGVPGERVQIGIVCLCLNITDRE